MINVTTVDICGSVVRPVDSRLELESALMLVGETMLQGEVILKRLGRSIRLQTNEMVLMLSGEVASFNQLLGYINDFMSKIGVEFDRSDWAFIPNPDRPRTVH